MEEEEEEGEATVATEEEVSTVATEKEVATEVAPQWPAIRAILLVVAEDTIVIRAMERALSHTNHRLTVHIIRTQ